MYGRGSTLNLSNFSLGLRSHQLVLVILLHLLQIINNLPVSAQILKLTELNIVGSFHITP